VLPFFRLNIFLLIFVFRILLFYLIFIERYRFIIELCGIFGLDYLRFRIIFLSFWVVFLVLLKVFEIKGINQIIYIFLTIFLFLVLFLSFVLYEFFLFYVIFEFVLFPILLIIFGWGFYPDRLQAGIYIFFYTVFISLPLIISFFIFYYFHRSLRFFIYMYNLDIGFYLWIFFILRIIVKFPIYIFHFWLPKAHVQAPVFGSIILAGVLLKLGGYGLIRLLPFTFNFFLFVNYFIILGLIGGIYIGIIAFHQTDLKLLVAYSSIRHIGLVFIGLLIRLNFRLYGGVLLIIGHGICSSCIFYLVDLIYNRIESRIFILVRGYLLILRGLCLWWVLINLVNMRCPVSINLLSEIFIFISVKIYCLEYLILIVFLCFMCSIYTLYLILFSYHGVMVYFFSRGEIKLRVYLIIFIHWILLNLVFLFLENFFYFISLKKYLFVE